MEGDPSSLMMRSILWHFNPLPPHGGRHVDDVRIIESSFISIHSLRMEGDIAGIVFCKSGIISIHSLRMEGDKFIIVFHSSAIHFNPLPPHGGRQCAICTGRGHRRISIHSLRMEGDITCSFCAAERADFNPLPPHGGRHSWDKSDTETVHFNPLPPHGGRQTHTGMIGGTEDISIHSLRMEGDVGCW